MQPFEDIQDGNSGLTSRTKIKNNFTKVGDALNQLFGSYVFTGGEVSATLPPFVLFLALKSDLANYTDNVFVDNVRRAKAYTTPSVYTRHLVRVTVGSTQVAVWFRDNYTEPTEDVKGRRIETITLLDSATSSIPVGYAVVDWSKLATDSETTFNATTGKLHPNTFNGVNFSNLSDIASLKTKTQLLKTSGRMDYTSVDVNASKTLPQYTAQMDAERVLVGANLDPALVGFIHDIKFSGLSVAKTSNVHIFNLWRNFVSSSYPSGRWVLDIAIDGNRFVQFIADGYTEPTPDSNGNIITTIQLPQFGSSGVTATAIVDWSVIPAGSQWQYNGANTSKAIISPKTYKTLITENSALSARVTVVENSSIFQGEAIDGTVRKFLLAIRSEGTKVMPAQGKYMYVNNVRRAKVYTTPSNFVRHLVRFAIDGVNVATWFRDGYTEPTPDANGDILDEITLTAEQSTGAYAGIKFRAIVNWRYLTTNSETIFENTDTERQKTRISEKAIVYKLDPVPNAPSSSIASQNIGTAYYTVFNDVDPRNNVQNPIATGRHDLANQLGVGLYVDRFLPSGFELNTGVRFAQTLTDKLFMVSPRANDLDVATPHPSPSGTYSVPLTLTDILGKYTDKSYTLTHNSTLLSAIADLITEGTIAIGDSTDVGLDSEVFIPDGLASKNWAMMHEQAVKTRIDYLLAKGYSETDITSLLATETSTVISAGDLAKFRYHTIGTGASNFQQTQALNFTYRGVNYQKTIKAEGRGGWGINTYINKPFNGGSPSQGIWDALGLGNGTGTDFVLNSANVYTIHRTAWNPSAIQYTTAFVTWAQGYGYTGTTLSQAQAWAQAKADSPENPFFDSAVNANITDLNGNTWQVKFSMSKYLARYRTYDDSGVKLPYGSPSKGSFITSNAIHDSMIVFRPRFVIMQSCQNDGDYPHFGQLCYVFSQRVKAEYSASSWAQPYIAFSIIDGAGTFFPKLYPNYDPFVFMDNGQRATHNNNLGRANSAITSQDTNKVWVIANTQVTPTAESIQGRKVKTPFFDFADDPSTQFYLKPSRANIGIKAHPNGKAQRVWGYHLWSWLAWAVTR